MASASSSSDNIYLEPPRTHIKLYTTILTDGTQKDGTTPPLSATLPDGTKPPAGTTHPIAYPNNTDVEILPIKRTDNKQPGFSLVKVVRDGVVGYIRTKNLLRTGAALRAAAAGHASGAAAAVAAVAVSSNLPLSTADLSQLLELNTPPFLIFGDHMNAITVMVHTSSPGAQLLNENGTPRGLYYPNGSQLRLVESRVSGTETGQAGTATSTLLVQIDDDDNDDGWLPMGCLLRTTVRNEFDIGRFWTMALAAEAPQNVVNSADEFLGTVQQAYDVYSRNKGAGFDFGKYGNDYELFRNEYMPHIFRPNEPVVPWVRRKGSEGMEGMKKGGTRRRKCKKGKKSRASHSSRASRSSRQLRRRRSRRSRR